MPIGLKEALLLVSLWCGDLDADKSQKHNEAVTMCRTAATTCIKKMKGEKVYECMTLGQMVFIKRSTKEK